MHGVRIGVDVGGDLVVIETCGGGGYGPPANRPPALIARDRREGYLA
jgi:N-methylhydantoinase B